MDFFNKKVQRCKLYTPEHNDNSTTDHFTLYDLITRRADVVMYPLLTTPSRLNSGKYFVIFSPLLSKRSFIVHKSLMKLQIQGITEIGSALDRYVWIAIMISACLFILVFTLSQLVNFSKISLFEALWQSAQVVLCNAHGKTSPQSLFLHI